MLEINFPCAYCGTEIEILEDTAKNLSIACPSCIDNLEKLRICMHEYGFDDLDEFISAIAAKKGPFVKLDECVSTFFNKIDEMTR